MVASTALCGQIKFVDISKAKISIIKDENNLQPPINDTVKIELGNKPKSISIKENDTTQVVLSKEKDSTTKFTKLLPLIFTVTGLIVGFLMNRFYEWYMSRKKIMKSGKRWNIELKTLEEPLKDQIKYIEEFAISVAKREWKYNSLELMTTINSERFSSLDKNDLMDYIDNLYKFPWYKRLFISEAKNQEQYNKAVKLSNHIHGFIDVLSHNFEMLNNKWNEFQDGISTATKKFNQDMESFNIQFNTLNFEIRNDSLKLYNKSEYSSFFNLYFQFIIMLQQNPNYNMHNFQKDFLDPAIKELAKFAKDQRILPIAASISVLSNDLRAINGEKDYVLDNMKELIIRYNKTLESLSTIIEKTRKNIAS